MSYKITVKGLAKTDHYDLSELDGIDCQDEFTEYFSKRYKDDDNEQALIDKKVHSGYMRFAYEKGDLWTITEYHCDEKLTEEELDILSEYTQGQWSDGIGEGFEQEPCFYTQDEDGEDIEVYVSPWSYNQKVTITQEEE